MPGVRKANRDFHINHLHQTVPLQAHHTRHGLPPVSRPTTVSPDQSLGLVPATVLVCPLVCYRMHRQYPVASRYHTLTTQPLSTTPAFVKTSVPCRLSSIPRDFSYDVTPDVSRQFLPQSIERDWL